MDYRDSRRQFLHRAPNSVAAAILFLGPKTWSAATANVGPLTPEAPGEETGAQRRSVARLRQWEALGYGMFIHFGMSTFVGQEIPDGKAPASTYNPDKLDVDQWIQVARDAGMRYAVLTTKHVAGHCLWPSRHTDYSVATSGNTTDVLGAFVKACERRGVLPGFYYCSWDNHHLFGSLTPSLTKWEKAFTTSRYQDFQTAQMTELLSQYGPIAEVWIDIPGVLGRGYRTFLYQRIAALQPDCVIMMNSGISDGADYNVDYAWPSDLIAIERNLPPASGHAPWRTIEGKRYYLPGEVCDPIGKEWFYVEGDHPRPDDELLTLLAGTRKRGANLLLDLGPDRHGLITGECRDALLRLRKNVGL
ncbi:MAG: alpha-L-fucosidase [Acidobacteria bacterium]|nr:alpha-L-fucosidase [Acidobacteriota bacterium]